MSATFDGKTSRFTISGAPDIYPLVSGNAVQQGILRVDVTAGLTAYSFTFG